MILRLLQVYAVIMLALLMGCSLLKFELKSDAVPLTPQQHELRSVAREFGELFFTAVEKTAEEIQHSNTSNIYKENAILWKINAQAVAIDAIYKNQPTIAFIDMWAFTIQMENFFKTESGKQLFGSWIKPVLETATKMRTDIQTIAKKQFSKEEYKKIEAFINGYVKENPITDITFKRYPIYSVWLAKTEATNKEAKQSKDGDKETTPTTVGTLPEVMSDLSDRLAAISRQLQKNVLWQTELLALNGDIDVKLLGKTVDNVYYSSVQLKNIFQNKENSMDYLAQRFRVQLEPLIKNMDAMVNSYLFVLQKESLKLTNAITNERIALEELIERERIALDAIIERERNAVLEKINTIRQDGIEQVMMEVKSLIKGILWLLIILFAVVLFIPFGFGVMFGKLLSMKKKNTL